MASFIVYKRVRNTTTRKFENSYLAPSGRFNHAARSAAMFSALEASEIAGRIGGHVRPYKFRN